MAQVQSTDASRISDEEMARINIESSAALAEWIDLCRADPEGQRYEQLVSKAVLYLPMPKNTSRCKGNEFAALADPEIATRVLQASDAERLNRIRTQADRFPSRIFANALVDFAWRNGPVESIHAGRFRGYPVDQRRVTPGEEQKLMTFASERLALGAAVYRQLAHEELGRPWSEQVLPYGLAEMLLITPSGWTLTESSREVRLQVAM